MIDIISDDSGFISDVVWYSVDAKINEYIADQLYAQMMGWA